MDLVSQQYLAFFIISKGSIGILILLIILVRILMLRSTPEESYPLEEDEEALNEEQTRQVVENFAKSKIQKEKNMSDSLSLFLYFKAIYPDYKLIFPTIMRLIFPLPKEFIIQTINFVIENTQKGEDNQNFSTLNLQKITLFNQQLRQNILAKYCSQDANDENPDVSQNMSSPTLDTLLDTSKLTNDASQEQHLYEDSNLLTSAETNISNAQKSHLSKRKSMFFNLSNLEESFAPMKRVYDLRQTLQMTASQLTDPTYLKTMLRRMDSKSLKMLGYQELWHFMVDLEEYVISSDEYHVAAEEFSEKMILEENDEEEEPLGELTKLLQQKASILLVFMKNMMAASLDAIVKQKYIKQVDNYEMRITEAQKSATKRRNSHIPSSNSRFSISYQRRPTGLADFEALELSNNDTQTEDTPCEPSLKKTKSVGLRHLSSNQKLMNLKINKDKLDSVREIEEDSEEEKIERERNSIEIQQQQQNGRNLSSLFSKSSSRSSSHSSDYSYGIGNQDQNDFDIEASPTHNKRRDNKSIKNFDQDQNFGLNKEFGQNSEDNNLSIEKDQKPRLNSLIFNQMINQYKVRPALNQDSPSQQFPSILSVENVEEEKDDNKLDIRKSILFLEALCKYEDNNDEYSAVQQPIQNKYSLQERYEKQNMRNSQVGDIHEILSQKGQRLQNLLPKQEPGEGYNFRSLIKLSYIQSQQSEVAKMIVPSTEQLKLMEVSSPVSFRLQITINDSSGSNQPQHQPSFNQIPEQNLNKQDAISFQTGIEQLNQQQNDHHTIEQTNFNLIQIPNVSNSANFSTSSLLQNNLNAQNSNFIRKDQTKFSQTQELSLKKSFKNNDLALNQQTIPITTSQNSLYFDNATDQHNISSSNSSNQNLNCSNNSFDSQTKKNLSQEIKINLSAQELVKEDNKLNLIPTKQNFKDQTTHEKIEFSPIPQKYEQQTNKQLSNQQAIAPFTLIASPKSLISVKFKNKTNSSKSPVIQTYKYNQVVNASEQEDQNILISQSSLNFFKQPINKTEFQGGKENEEAKTQQLVQHQPQKKILLSNNILFSQDVHAISSANENPVNSNLLEYLEKQAFTLNQPDVQQQKLETVKNHHHQTDINIQPNIQLINEREPLITQNKPLTLESLQSQEILVSNQDDNINSTFKENDFSDLEQNINSIAKQKQSQQKQQEKQLLRLSNYSKNLTNSEISKILIEQERPQNDVLLLASQQLLSHQELSPIGNKQQTVLNIGLIDDQQSIQDKPQISTSSIIYSPSIINNLKKSKQSINPVVIQIESTSNNEMPNMEQSYQLELMTSPYQTDQTLSDKNNNANNKLQVASSYPLDQSQEALSKVDPLKKSLQNNNMSQLIKNDVIDYIKDQNNDVKLKFNNKAINNQIIESDESKPKNKENLLLFNSQEKQQLENDQDIGTQRMIEQFLEAEFQKYHSPKQLHDSELITPLNVPQQTTLFQSDQNVKVSIEQQQTDLDKLSHQPANQLPFLDQANQNQEDLLKNDLTVINVPQTKLKLEIQKINTQQKTESISQGHKNEDDIINSIKKESPIVFNQTANQQELQIKIQNSQHQINNFDCPQAEMVDQQYGFLVEQIPQILQNLPSLEQDSVPKIDNSPNSVINNCFSLNDSSASYINSSEVTGENANQIQQQNDIKISQDIKYSNQHEQQIKKELKSLNEAALNQTNESIVDETEINQKLLNAVTDSTLNLSSSLSLTKPVKPLKKAIKQNSEIINSQHSSLGSQSPNDILQNQDDLIFMNQTPILANESKQLENKQNKIKKTKIKDDNIIQNQNQPILIQQASNQKSQGLLENINISSQSSLKSGLSQQDSPNPKIKYQEVKQQELQDQERQKISPIISKSQSKVTSPKSLKTQQKESEESSEEEEEEKKGKEIIKIHPVSNQQITNELLSIKNDTLQIQQKKQQSNKVLVKHYSLENNSDNNNNNKVSNETEKKVKEDQAVIINQIIIIPDQEHAVQRLKTLEEEKLQDQVIDEVDNIQDINKPKTNNKLIKTNNKLTKSNTKKENSLESLPIKTDKNILLKKEEKQDNMTSPYVDKNSNSSSEQQLLSPVVQNITYYENSQPIRESKLLLKKSENQIELQNSSFNSDNEQNSDNIEIVENINTSSPEGSSEHDLSIQKPKAKKFKGKKKAKKGKKQKKIKSTADRAQNIYSIQHMPNFDKLSGKLSLVAATYGIPFHSNVASPHLIQDNSHDQVQNINQKNVDETSITNIGSNNSFDQKQDDGIKKTKKQFINQSQITMLSPKNIQDQVLDIKNMNTKIVDANLNNINDQDNLKINDTYIKETSPVEKRNEKQEELKNQTKNGRQKSKHKQNKSGKGRQNQTLPQKELQIKENQKKGVKYSNWEDVQDFCVAYNFDTAPSNYLKLPLISEQSPIVNYQKIQFPLDGANANDDSQQYQRAHKNVPIKKLKTFQMKNSIIDRNSYQDIAAGTTIFDGAPLQQNNQQNEQSQSIDYHHVPTAAFGLIDRQIDQHHIGSGIILNQKNKNSRQLTDERMQTSMQLSDNDMLVSSSDSEDGVIDHHKPVVAHKDLFSKIIDQNKFQKVVKEQQAETQYGGQRKLPHANEHPQIPVEIDQQLQPGFENIQKEQSQPQNEKVSTFTYIDEVDKYNFCYNFDN